MITKYVIKKSAVLAVCGALISSSSFAAQTVILKNGDRLTGDFASSSSESSVRFESIYGAVFEIPKSEIVAYQEQNAQVATSIEPAAAQNEADLVVDIDPAAGKDSVEYEWSGRANIGAFLDDGNSQKRAISGDAEITARNKKNRWIAGGDVHFANDEGAETENDQSLYGEYNRFVTDKWFYGLRQDFQIDKIADFFLRSKTGPFVGYQFFEEDDLNLKVRLGGNYVYEDFESGDVEESAALAWALNYDQSFFSQALTLFHNHEIDTPFDEVDAFLFQSDTGIRVPVGKHLTGTAQVDFDWDNAPAIGIEEGDTKYAVKIGYEW